MKVSEEGGGGYIVTLSKALDSAAKIISYVNFIVFALLSVVALRAIIKDLQDNYSGKILFISVEIIGLVLCVLIGYRFFRRATWKEILIIDKEQLVAKKGSMLGMKRFAFPIAELSRFRFLKKPELTPHPLAGQTMDYLGFDTEQKLVNEVHGDDLMAFDYRGKFFSFGQNATSWEYDEIAELILQLSGRDIRGEG